MERCQPALACACGQPACRKRLPCPALFSAPSSTFLSSLLPRRTTIMSALWRASGVSPSPRPGLQLSFQTEGVALDVPAPHFTHPSRHQCPPSEQAGIWAQDRVRRLRAPGGLAARRARHRATAGGGRSQQVRVLACGCACELVWVGEQEGSARGRQQRGRSSALPERGAPLPRCALLRCSTTWIRQEDGSQDFQQPR